jgi:hypothetical protein
MAARHGPWRWLEWALLLVSIILAIAANFPEQVAQQWGIDQRYVVGLLSILLLFGLLKYATFALILTTVVLCIGANLPHELAARIGVNSDVLLVALVGVVVVGLIGRFTNWLPSGIVSDTDIRRRNVEALLGAIYNINTQEVDALLRSGVSVNVRSVTNRTPLMLATALGSRTMVRLLLRYGADVSAKDEEGITALAIASRRGLQDIVDDLVHAGAME